MDRRISWAESFAREASPESIKPVGCAVRTVTASWRAQRALRALPLRARWCHPTPGRTYTWRGGTDHARPGLVSVSERHPAGTDVDGGIARPGRSRETHVRRLGHPRRH